MAFGAPIGTKAAIAKPGANALPGNCIGAGCQGNLSDVV